MKHHPAWLATGLLAFAFLACNLGEQNANNSNSTPQPEASVQEAQPSNAAPMHVAALVKEFETNEVRANQQWVGKRVRVYGTVNTIEIGKDGSKEGVVIIDDVRMRVPEADRDAGVK